MSEGPAQPPPDEPQPQGVAVIAHVEPGSLTLGELRRALAAVPSRYDDVAVYTEGCDCIGPCSGFELDSQGLKAILLLRRRDG